MVTVTSYQTPAMSLDWTILQRRPSCVFWHVQGSPRFDSDVVKPNPGPSILSTLSPRLGRCLRLRPRSLDSTLHCRSAHNHGVCKARSTLLGQEPREYSLSPVAFGVSIAAGPNKAAAMRVAGWLFVRQARRAGASLSSSPVRELHHACHTLGFISGSAHRWPGKADRQHTPSNEKAHARTIFGH